ncbi:MAG TPA: hypothetical protein VK104_04295, partial [Burkholderiaceae bacterium]|nr:hypothetical protein [Burkholderiaceae bacterium]
MLVTALMLVMALFMLGTRLWLFPQIDHFRPWIAGQLSTALGVDVSMGKLQVRWQRWQLRMQVQDLELRSARGRHLLSLPDASALLSWRSLIKKQPWFASLQLQGLDITVQRTARDRLDVLGQTVRVATRKLQQLPLHTPAMQWLLTQPQVHVSQSTIRWMDETRLAPPMIWNDVVLSLRNAGRRHQFGLTAHTAAAEGASIDIRGNLLQRSDGSRIRRLDGELYLDLVGRDPQTWQPWVNWPGHIEADTARVQAWVDIEDNALTTVVADIDAAGANWRYDRGVAASARQARAIIRAPAGAWDTLDNMDVRMQAHDARLQLEASPGIPFAARAISAHAGLTRDPDGLAVEVDKLVLDSPDVQATGRVHWTNRVPDEA